MKKLTMTVAMLVTVMSMAVASGNGSKSTRVNVLSGSNQVYKVIYSAKESNVVIIRIRNEKGQIIRTDRIKNDGGFLQPYNLSELDLGKYSIEISDKLGIVTEEIEIKNQQTAHVSSLDNKRFKFMVTSEKSSDLTLSIFSEDGILVYEESHDNSKGFSRIYDLSKFDSDSYIFELNGLKQIERLAVQ